VTPLEETDAAYLSRLKCAGCSGPLEARLDRSEVVLRRPATILCIDDDRLLLGMFSDALEAQGYRTLLATAGAAGIEIAKKSTPDLIVLDVVMPEMDGIEVCRRFRAEPRLAETPIILLTAVADPDIEAKGRAAGATLTVRKPFGPALVVSIIHEILGRTIDPLPL
jgi:DNA-binding response OmpR family regulator